MNNFEPLLCFTGISEVFLAAKAIGNLIQTVFVQMDRSIIGVRAHFIWESNQATICLYTHKFRRVREKSGWIKVIPCYTKFRSGPRNFQSISKVPKLYINANWRNSLRRKVSDSHRCVLRRLVASPHYSAV